jgi:hypothetical protein
VRQDQKSKYHAFSLICDKKGLSRGENQQEKGAGKKRVLHGYEHAQSKLYTYIYIYIYIYTHTHTYTC